MGIDLETIIDHRLSPTQIDGLKSILDGFYEELIVLLPVVGLGKEHIQEARWWDWNPEFDPPLSEWIRQPGAWIRGPGSLSITVGVDSFNVHTWIRWREFLSESAVREGWRDVMPFFGRKFSSTAAIHVPDSGGEGYPATGDNIYKGWTFAQIEQGLVDECGPPNRSPTELLQVFDGKGYLKEDLRDLSV